MNRNCYEERKEWNMTISFVVILPSLIQQRNATSLHVN